MQFASQVTPVNVLLFTFHYSGVIWGKCLNMFSRMFDRKINSTDIYLAASQLHVVREYDLNVSIFILRGN